MWMMAVLALTTAPMAWWLRGRPQPKTAVVENPMTLRQQLKIAACNRSYWCLQVGFFTCGFYIAFLVTHLLNEVNLCGLTALRSTSSRTRTNRRHNPRCIMALPQCFIMQLSNQWAIKNPIIPDRVFYLGVWWSRGDLNPRPPALHPRLYMFRTAY